jgi:hypothetical protein
MGEGRVRVKPPERVRPALSLANVVRGNRITIDCPVSLIQPLPQGRGFYLIKVFVIIDY